MAKKSNTPLEVVKGENTPKKENTAVKPTATAKEPTKEELLKRVAELEKQAASIPQNLDEKIQYFNRKKELISKLTRMKDWTKKLNEHIQNIAEIATQNEFETEDYTLTIENGSSYNKSNVFKLDNPVIIGDTISFIVGLLEAKQDDLQAQIEA